MVEQGLVSRRAPYHQACVPFDRVLDALLAAPHPLNARPARLLSASIWGKHPAIRPDDGAT